MLYCRPPTGDLLGPTVRGVVDGIEVSVYCCIVVLRQVKRCQFIVVLSFIACIVVLR